jgi:hypothetical protein
LTENAMTKYPRNDTLTLTGFHRQVLTFGTTADNCQGWHNPWRIPVTMAIFRAVDFFSKCCGGRPHRLAAVSGYQIMERSDHISRRRPGAHGGPLFRPKWPGQLKIMN